MSQYDERLYEHFHKEKNTFHRWLSATVLVCIFYVLVFQPYLTLLEDLEQLEFSQLENAEQTKLRQTQLQDTSAAIERAISFMGDASQYQQLYEVTQSWVDDIDAIEQAIDTQAMRVAHLREQLPLPEQQQWQFGKLPGSHVITLLKQINPQQMQNYHVKDDCFFRVNNDWVICQVQKKREAINTKLSKVMYNRSPSFQYTDLLKNQIETVQAEHYAQLTQALAESGLKAWVMAYMNDEQKIIRDWYEYMARQRLDGITATKHLQEQQSENLKNEAALQKHKKELAQAGEIDTPLGVIKVGIDDFISLIPLLTLILMSALLNSMHRQLALRTSYAKHAPTELAKDDALLLIMPLYLEPFKTWFSGIVISMILLIPALFALQGLWQLIHNSVSLPLKVNADYLAATTLLAAILLGHFYVRLLKSYYQIKTTNHKLG